MLLWGKPLVKSEGHTVMTMKNFIILNVIWWSLVEVYQRFYMVLFICLFGLLFDPLCLLGLLFDPEDGGSTFLGNIGKF
jgi:hypothetical protein